MRFTRHRHPRGMALLEVLLACAVFAIVGTALLKAVRSMADAVRSTNRQNEVRLGLQGRLAQAQALPVSTGVSKEQPDESGVVYEREWRALPMVNQDKEVLSDLYLLVVRARWTYRHQDNVEEASLRLYKP